MPQRFFREREGTVLPPALVISFSVRGVDRFDLVQSAWRSL